MLNRRACCLLTRQTLNAIAKQYGQEGGGDAETAIARIKDIDIPDASDQAIMAMQGMIPYFPPNCGMYQAIIELDADGVCGKRCVEVAELMEEIING